MSVSARAAGVTRQALFDEYQRSPESAPLKRTALVNTAAFEDYQFEKSMARTQGGTAAELIDVAEKNARFVKKGCGFAFTRGIVAFIAGIASLAFGAAFPLLILVGLPCLYFGSLRIRDGNDKIRLSRYDLRFAADVARYAARLSGGEATSEP